MDEPEPLTMSELAGRLAAQVTRDSLSAFVATATATAAMHGGDEIGAELSELLLYLP